MKLEIGLKLELNSEWVKVISMILSHPGNTIPVPMVCSPGLE